jgi:hypothetical protein
MRPIFFQAAERAGRNSPWKFVARSERFCERIYLHNPSPRIVAPGWRGGVGNCCGGTGGGARSPSHGKCSKRFCGSSRSYGRSHRPRQHEAFDCHAFKRNRQEECVQMPVKIARSSPSTIVRAARAAGSHPHLASVLLQGRKKREYSRQFGSHPGNPG